jgi:hypothetical protein
MRSGNAIASGEIRASAARKRSATRSAAISTRLTCRHSSKTR